MSTHRYPGGVISATPPTANSGGAVGVWTLEEALRNKQAGNWPDGSGLDPYFENVTLLLHGDGTNGAQNNTFLDSSTNNFTITRNGNTTQGSFDPYVGPGNWSNYFNGTTDYLSAASSSAFGFGTGDFTVEYWVYATSWSTSPTIVDLRAASGNSGFSDFISTGGAPNMYWYNTTVLTSTLTIPLNTWTHVAYTRASNAIKIFVNGALGASGTSASDLQASVPCKIGATFAPSNYFAGYLSNVRIVKGAALYTSAFTPSTTPLIATTQTTFLTCNSNGFNDLSAANNTITRNGSAQVSKFSPFTLYQTTPASYSGYFDGTGDYLAVSTTANAAFGFGTADFTVEAWVYYTGTNASATKPIVDFRGAVATAPSIFGYTSNQLALYYNGSVVYQPASLTLTSNAWNHVALVRSSGVTKFYLNGTGASTTYTDTNNYPSAACIIGTDSLAGGSSYWIGSLSNIRVVKGVAVYTTNFTPPTSPLTAISGTSLLTCQSTTFIDNSTNAFAITVNGNATPKVANPFTDTVTGPIAYSTSGDGGSGYFDGTGDYLVGPTTNANLWPGSGSFTIEYWLYIPANPTTGYYTHFSYGTTGSVLRVFNSASVSKIEVFSGASVILNPTWPNAGGWNHFALVRNGTTLSLYINGTLAQSATNSTDFSAGTLNIGGEGATNNLLGYISNFRLVKGTAIYTAPFVPPAAPVTAVTNTQLLVNGTNAGIFDNSTVNDLETVGNAQISTSVVKYGTGSMSFNGTNSYLTARTNPTMALGTGNFTIEYWINATSFSTTPTIIDFRGSANNLGFSDYITTAGQINIWKSTASILSATSNLTTGTWYFIAYVRNSGTLTIYINGVASGSVADTTNWVAPSDVMNIASYKAGAGGYFNGYLDDIRVTLGVARYTANFTPPTGPFPNI